MLGRLLNSNDQSAEAQLLRAKVFNILRWAAMAIITAALAALGINLGGCGFKPQRVDITISKADSVSIDGKPIDAPTVVSAPTEPAAAE